MDYKYYRAIKVIERSYLFIIIILIYLDFVEAINFDSEYLVLKHLFTKY